MRTALLLAAPLPRPGPLDAGLCEDYIQIKQGTKIAAYEHPNMAPALKETYGVIVYQEQIMQVCRDVAGFTFEQADNVRRQQGTKPIHYEHPNMRAALESTHGVIVYQEQITQICRDLAGFTFTEADHDRDLETHP